ncbi:hypothetical protein FOL47_003927 [Perkinsus chesapeaki]|uniref:Uncharacterized protein n=1 Tax=Perkinsus chesapeaki TaxID=330153 RepID=A0A7J6M5C5_PERCH|nr:hypothetical protein FOL47_003927 [Perkinsus chesapeaki]
MAAVTSTPGMKPNLTWKEKISHAWSDTTNGSNALIRILGALAAIATFVAGLLSMFNFFNMVTNPLSYILGVFFMIFGLVLTFIELFPGAKLSKVVFSQAKFLSHLLGRGSFYLYLGLLFTCGGVQHGFTSIVGFVVGIYLIAVAVIYFIWGFTHRKEVSMTEPLNGATNV